ncbi:protein phosphatase 1 regulatory subunit 12A isoform X3 [Plodia interpunctella]|uniref:protein phosphatase 1 regulatory subunit 12A isoform X3 n=1 Tax=Plodia interpunctella TaxID=58824 RepID=UPI002368E6DA|nr:protein phosphatase 1 regulatory subunit 12A isoform X3 [Plodia interpunctella]
MTDTRSSSALFKRAEQLKRWEESDTNKQSPMPKRASRIQFSSGIVFLAACTAGDKDEVQRLLKMGADINTANVDGLTALHQACIDDNLDMVEFLVKNGADINRGDNEGWTALHATASCGFLSIARFLLENGADVGAVNYDGELAVDIAESDEMEELLQKAIDEKGVDCEKSRNAEVDTLLNDARNWAANGYVEVRDPKTGGTPLHVAAAKGYIEVAKMLLEECKASPDSVDYEGWTPLHAAALWGQKDAAALLLKYGADPQLNNYSGQTCMDLADPSISAWLSEATLKVPRRVNNNNNNNNNKRKRSPPRHDVKRVELEITGQTDNNVNDKPPAAPDIITKISDGKPPKGRAPSPESTENTENVAMEDAPSWRRSASFRNRQPDPARENKSANNNTVTVDNETILRRTHSFENDKTTRLDRVSLLISRFDRSRSKNSGISMDDFYQRYRDVTARIKASSCPSIPPLRSPLRSTLAAMELRIKETNNAESTNADVQTRVSPTDRRDRDANTWTAPSTTAGHTKPNTTIQTTVRSSSSESVESQSNSSNSTPSAATPTKLSPGNIFKNFFKSFVPPVRDEESETQRKAHAKRVRETRRSTQGVTLDEIKSAEQLVKKKAGNGVAESPTLPNQKKEDTLVSNSPDNGTARGGDVAVTLALACATATATATIAANSERRPSWRLRLDPTNKFELEDAGRSSPRPGSATTSPASTTVTTVSSTITTAAEATVTLPLRRPPAASTVNTTSTPAKEEKEKGEEEKERESSIESKSSSNPSPASTQAALNVIQRRRRPKRRSTGVGHVDMDDIVNDRGGGGEGDGDSESLQSGNERTEEGEERDYKALYEASSNEVRRLRTSQADGDKADDGDKDYKALYEASMVEIRRLRELLATSEQQLRDARATITRLTQVNQNSLSEIEKREKRAMERKLSEMEEELKFQQALQAENQRLKDENGALIRVISKLSK